MTALEKECSEYIAACYPDGMGVQQAREWRQNFAAGFIAAIALIFQSLVADKSARLSTVTTKYVEKLLDEANLLAGKTTAFPKSNEPKA